MSSKTFHKSSLIVMFLMRHCSNPDFPMFASMLNHKDLMFQDSTVRLVAIKEKKQNYRDYLGASFIRAMERNDEIDCITSSANQVALVSVKQTTLVVCLVYLLASCLRWCDLLRHFNQNFSIKSRTNIDSICSVCTTFLYQVCVKKIRWNVMYMQCCHFTMWVG